MPLKKPCSATADLGHTNLWGTPYLKFTVRCDLPAGHSGKHQGQEPVRLAPTHEGMPVDAPSIEHTPTITIKWLNK